MKTSQDPRHKKREREIQLLYQFSFQPEKTDSLIKPVLKALPKIDKLITSAAPSWPIEKLNKVDLAILRLAVYELKINPEAPPKVIIDEAVELAKKYGSESSSRFVNGALGTLYKTKNKR
ncbi:transcription antitermination factor NusB [Candidatus Beckwithbacteria bacterium RBG_13_42_9]|uniref:Transcription antitermination protein NusB n=1 Tax=Candidatus Beckwithbacteria bacterium RBG_13_42_9 TaxID=1797457 RepID=A0A1F5E5C1_9BACT|nr:MAG: transcription antitermination factor NusB [Candidatus Beckwithbacteria bacterium RBG_13_42_9]